MIKVSERPIKPGTHTVTVRLEVRPGKKSEKEHEGLGYEFEHTFVVNVPDGNAPPSTSPPTTTATCPNTSPRSRSRSNRRSDASDLCSRC